MNCLPICYIFSYCLYVMMFNLCDHASTCVLPIFFPLILSTKMITAVPVIEVHCFVIPEVCLVYLTACSFLMFAPLNAYKIKNKKKYLFAPLNRKKQRDGNLPSELEEFLNKFQILSFDAFYVSFLISIIFVHFYF